MNIIIKEFLAPALLVIIGAISTYITWLLQQSKKTTDANATGTMLLLRREIISDYNKYVIEGADLLPLVFADLEEIHNAYKALGGNGMTDKMYQELKDKTFAKGGI